MKKRILSALAALCLVFCSCSSSDPDKSPSSDSIYENVGPSTSVSDGNVDVNYSSYEFTVLSSYAFDYEDTGIFEGERNSDKVNEALAKRKQEIEKSFNIVLSEQLCSSASKELENDILLGESSFDMIYASAADISLLLGGERLIDLADFSAFDLAKGYFDSSVSSLSVAGKTYALAGDFCMGTTAATSAVLVNNLILNKLDVKSEFKCNLFELVEMGDWTLDAMMRLNTLASTHEPSYPDFFAPSSSALSLLFGQGAAIFEKGESDIPTLAVTGAGFSALYDRIASLGWNYGSLDTSSLFGVCDDFANKETEALFTIATVGEAKALADAGLCFSMVPMPKADTKQSDYISRVVLDRAELVAIPRNTSDLARSAAVLAALFENSADTKKAYLETYETACTHDSDRMLDIIIRTKKYDLGDLFGWGDFDEAIGADLISEEKKPLDETLAPRALVAEKALDIVLKRLLGENYKE